MATTSEQAEVQAFETLTSDRGVVTIPAELHQTAGLHANDPVLWVPLAPRVWLVAPPDERPTELAPALANALLAERSPFPKLMHRLATVLADAPQRGVERGYRRVGTPQLTERQMMALGAAEAVGDAAPGATTASGQRRHRRGRG